MSCPSEEAIHEKSGKNVVGHLLSREWEKASNHDSTNICVAIRVWVWDTPLATAHTQIHSHQLTSLHERNVVVEQYYGIPIQMFDEHFLCGAFFTAVFFFSSLLRLFSRCAVGFVCPSSEHILDVILLITIWKMCRISECHEMANAVLFYCLRASEVDCRHQRNERWWRWTKQAKKRQTERKRSVKTHIIGVEFMSKCCECVELANTRRFNVWFPIEVFITIFISIFSLCLFDSYRFHFILFLICRSTNGSFFSRSAVHRKCHHTRANTLLVSFDIWKIKEKYFDKSTRAKNRSKSIAITVDFAFFSVNFTSFFSVLFARFQSTTTGKIYGCGNQLVP